MGALAVDTVVGFKVNSQMVIATNIDTANTEPRAMARRGTLRSCTPDPTSGRENSTAGSSLDSHLGWGMLAVTTGGSTGGRWVNSVALGRSIGSSSTVPGSGSASSASLTSVADWKR